VLRADVKMSASRLIVLRNECNLVVLLKYKNADQITFYMKRGMRNSLFSQLNTNMGFLKYFMFTSFRNISV
jgi:hypothetical protein